CHSSGTHRVGRPTHQYPSVSTFGFNLNFVFLPPPPIFTLPRTFCRACFYAARAQKSLVMVVSVSTKVSAPASMRTGVRPGPDDCWILHDRARRHYWKGTGLLSIKTFFGGIAQYEVGHGALMSP